MSTTQIISPIVIFCDVILGFLILIQNKKTPSHQIYLVMSFVAALWTLANYLDKGSESLFWFKTSYSLGAVLISCGLVWTKSIIKNKLTKNDWLLTISIGLIFSIFSYFPGFIFQSIVRGSLGSIPIGKPGWGLIFYAIFYLVYGILIISSLNTAKNKTSNLELKRQFLNIYYGALITLFVTLLSSFILPYFSIFPFGATDDIGFLIFLIFIAYSITRHRLFNIRVIAIELVTFTLWIFILVRILVSTDQNEIFMNIGFLVITVILGTTLIRSTLHEISQSEKMQKMSIDLKSSYEQVKILNEQISEIQNKN